LYTLVICMLIQSVVIVVHAEDSCLMLDGYDARPEVSGYRLFDRNHIASTSTTYAFDPDFPSQYTGFVDGYLDEVPGNWANLISLSSQEGAMGTIYYDANKDVDVNNMADIDELVNNHAVAGLYHGGTESTTLHVTQWTLEIYPIFFSLVTYNGISQYLCKIGDQCLIVPLNEATIQQLENPYYTDYMREATMTHEIGHAFGLNENNFNGSIMAQGNNTSTSPTDAEVRGMKLVTHQHSSTSDGYHQTELYTTVNELTSHYQRCTECYAYSDQTPHTYMVEIPLDYDAALTLGDKSYEMPNHNTKTPEALPGGVEHGYMCNDCDQVIIYGEHNLTVDTSDALKHKCIVCEFTENHDYEYTYPVIEEVEYHRGVCRCGDVIEGVHVAENVPKDHNYHNRQCEVGDTGTYPCVTLKE